MEFDSLKDIKLLLGRQGGDVLADIEREIALLTRPDFTSLSQATGSTVFTDADEQERLRLEAELESDLEKLDISLVTEELTKEQSTTFQQTGERETREFDTTSHRVSASTPRRTRDSRQRDSTTPQKEHLYEFEDTSTKSPLADTSPDRRVNSLSEEKIKQLLEKINNFNFDENVASDSMPTQTDPGPRLVGVEQEGLSHFSDNATIDLGPELNNLSFSLSHSGTYNHSGNLDHRQSSSVPSTYQRKPEATTLGRMATISREKLTSFEMNTNEEDSLRRKIEVLLGVSKDTANSQEAGRTPEKVDDNGMSRIHEILDEESLGSEPELELESARPDDSAAEKVTGLSTDPSTANSKSFKSGTSFMKEIERQRELSRYSYKESDDDFNLDDLRELILQDEDALAEKYHSPDSAEEDMPSEPQLSSQGEKPEISFNSISSKPRIDFGSLLDMDSSHPSDKKSSRSGSKSEFGSSQSNPSHLMNSPSLQEAPNVVIANGAHSFSDKHSTYSMDEIDKEFAQDLRTSESEVQMNGSEFREKASVEPALITSTPSRGNHAPSPQSISASGFSSYTDQLPPASISDPGQSHHQALVLETLQSLQKQVDQLQTEKMNGTREVEQLKSKLEKQRLLLKKYEKSQSHTHRSSIKGMTSSQIHDRELDKKKLQQLMAEKEHLHSIIEQLQAQNEELDRRNELDKNALTQNLVETRDEALIAIRKFEEQLHFKNKEIEAFKIAANKRQRENGKDTSAHSESNVSKSSIGLSDVEHFRSEVQSERRIRKVMEKYGLSRSEALKLIQKIVQDRKLQKERRHKQKIGSSHISSHGNGSLESLQEPQPKNRSTFSEKLTHISSSKLKRSPSDPFVRSDNNLFRKLYQSSKLGSEGNSIFRHLSQSHSKPSILSDTYRRQELDFFDHMTHRASENRVPSQGYVEETPTRYKGKSSFSLLHNNSTLPTSKRKSEEPEKIRITDTNISEKFPENVPKGLKTTIDAHQATITSTPLSHNIQSQHARQAQPQKTSVPIVPITSISGGSKKDVGTQSSMIFTETDEEPRTKDACVQNSTFFGIPHDSKTEDDQILDKNSEDNSAPIMNRHSPIHEYKIDEALPSPRIYYNTNLLGKGNPLNSTKEVEDEPHNLPTDNPANTPQGNWKVVKNAVPMSIAAQTRRSATNAAAAATATATAVGSFKKKLPFIVGTNTGKSHSITVNLQKMFSTVQKHSPTACTVCQDRRGRTSNGTIPHNRTNDPRNDPRQIRLERVIKTLEDEFVHLKIQYQKAVSLYEAIDLVKQPLLQEQKREITQQLNDVIQAMEKKADQIINLRDLRETKISRKPAQIDSTPMNLKILRGSQLIQQILDN